MKELAEFSGELSLEGLHFWKTVFLAMTHPAAAVSSTPHAQGAMALPARTGQAKLDPSSASDKKVVLLPCKNPPSRERVQLWLEARRQYESLQKDRRDAELLKKGSGLDVEGNPEKTEQPGDPSCPAVTPDFSQRLSSIRTQRRKKRKLTLVISPTRIPDSPCSSSDASPVADEDIVDIKQDGRGQDDGSDLSTSPESAELPPWQQSCSQTPCGADVLSPKSVEPLSPRLSNSQEKLGDNLSPSYVTNREEERTSPLLDHGTPFLRRRRRSKEGLEPLCSTPISPSEGKKAAVLSRVVTTTCLNFLLLITVTLLCSSSSCRRCCFSEITAEEEKPGRPTEESVIDHTDKGRTVRTVDLQSPLSGSLLSL